MAANSKIVVVGAGLIGRKHIELVSGMAELLAIVDPAPASREISATHEVPWFADLGECLSQVRPDGVIIASPNGCHLDHASACLEARIPVLVEKPLADTSDAGRRIADLADETGVPVLVGHHRRHSPVIREAKTTLESDELGRLVAVNAMFWLNKPEDYFEMEWRTKKGGGPTYINLIHDIDLLQHLCGPIRAVQAREGRAVRGHDVEDTSAVILSFANGVLGTVTITDTVSAPWSWELTSGENPVYPKTDQSCYTIGGTKGSLSLPDLRVWSHVGEQSWWSPINSRTLNVEQADPVAEQFRHFLDVIAHKSEPIVSARDGLGNIEVLEAIKSAAESGGTVVVG